MAEQEALKKKIKKRNGHRLVIKNTIAKAKELLPPPDEDTAPRAVRVKLDSLRATIEKKRETIEALDDEIEELYDDQDIEREILERSELEEEIEEILSRIKAIHDETEHRNTITHENVSGSRAHATVKVKLPKLSLTIFDGNPTQWITFWDSFQSTIHEHPDLSNVDKLKYLQKSLVGDAAHTIAGLQITHENYDEAIQLLEKRFGNKQIIISRHIESIMDLPKIISNEDLRGLRSLYDKMESATRSLKSIGVSSDSYSAVLSPVIMSKLPQELRLLISRKLEDEWDVIGLLEQLGEELTLREKCSLATIADTHRSKEPRGDTRNLAFRRPQPTVATLITENNQPENRFIPNCLFCGQKHYSASCSIVTDPDARRKLLQEKRKCFVCLKSGHNSRSCTSRTRCYYCKGKHHSSICGSRAQNPSNYAEKSPQHYRSEQSARQPYVEPSQQNVSQSRNYVSTNLYTAQDFDDYATLLQTAKAQVHRIDNQYNVCNVRLILDSCSQTTYITSRLRDRLQLPTVKTSKVLIKEFGNNEGTLKTCDTVQLAVKCADNLTVYINAYVVDLICSPVSNQVINIAQSMFPHLTNLPLADSGDGLTDLEVDVMIGADFVHCFLLDKVVRGEQPLSPVAILTRFGFVLSGPVPVSAHNSCTSNITVAHTLKTGSIIVENQCEVTREIKEFWDRENVGVKSKQPQSETDALMNDKITFDGKRYEVSLPVKESHPVIPDNFNVAKTRLNSQLNRLKSKPELFAQYNAVIKEQLNSGIIERIDEEDDDTNLGSKHYIPHTGVVKQERKTTKLRVVYDASSKAAGEVSLNECLHSGPNLIPLIFDVLLRFRMQKVALIGDMEKAFLQISIDPEQRDLLRFLWMEDANLDNPKIAKFRFARLPFGLTCSPFILNATIRYHLKRYEESDPKFVCNVVRSLYVDDYACAFASEDEAFEVYEKLKRCFKEGGFNMRKWASNDQGLLNRIHQSEKVFTFAEKLTVLDSNVSKTEENSIKTNEDKESNVLGIAWNQKSDTFKFDLTNVFNSTARELITKRHILSSIARIYDPLGLLCPAMLPLKQLFQDVCKLKVNWDSQLPEEFCQRWCDISRDLSANPTIQIERCIMGHLGSNDALSLEIHGFADASKSAYGAVVYLRINTNKDSIVKLIAAKSKIAPLKGETIPRLELMAALTLAQLISSVHKALSNSCDIQNIFCWSDSQVVLYWIHDDTKLQTPFVQTRLKQLRSLIAKEKWGYCPSHTNPADIVSRGIAFSKLSKSSLWWNGPDFLTKKAEHWPKFEMSQENKIKQNVSEHEESSNVLISTAKPVVSLNSVIPCENFSNFDKLIRVTTLVFKFIKLLRRELSNETREEMYPSEITNEAKNRWAIEAQRSFENDQSFKETKKNLQVFSDSQGVLRVGGRIDNAPLSYETKYPVLLPRGHHLSRLIVTKSHETVKHNGIRETLTELRSEYWISKGRQLIKSILSKCVTCKELIGKPYDTPCAPPLPPYRVSEDAAFSQIGIDFAGPLFVRDIYNNDNQSSKCYIALFSCASTRAIHLELVPDLRGSTFIRALKRFISRRGIPARILSDNGKTFIDCAVQKFVNSKGIVWRFNIPKASWWGGIFEIMVKLTKRCLRKTLKNALLTYEELETVLIETEAILNSRPLTFVYEDVTQTPLTPSCLVTGRRLLDKHEITRNNADSDKTTLTRRAKYLETLLGRFFTQWKKEYLTSLRERYTSKGKQLRRIPKEGDIVTIHNDKTPRQKWKLGKITRLLPGRDNIVRAVEVRTTDNSGKVVVLKRSIQHLYPIEVQHSLKQVDQDKVPEEEKDVQIAMIRDEDVTTFIKGR